LDKVKSNYTKKGR